MCFTSYENSQLCFCTDTSNCTYPSGISPNLTCVDSYTYGAIIIPPTSAATQVEGLHTGCMPFESLMESTLECFYNNDCLSKLFDSRSVQSLKSEINSVYTINTKVNVLIQELFIENLSTVTDFELFYSECKPNKCFYSYNSKGTVAFVILTILSLTGGLFVALQIMSMFIIEFYTKIKQKCFNRSSSDEHNEGKWNDIVNDNYFS